MCYLQTGHKQTKKHEIGKEFITGLHSAGEFFGYASLLEGVKYTDTAEALENSVITFVPQEVFFDLLYKNADVAKSFIQLLSGNLTEQEERLMNLAYSSVRKRLSDTLVNLYEKHSADKNHTLTFSREDLANIAGTAIETTIRTLSDFKSEGLIEIKGTAIQVMKLDKLKAMRN
jgi:CRP-like cAMP-binding protein